ncbi:ATP-binding cassette sub-family F member 1-like [Lagopus leucura]|uniref:ATP-binding cassette sub-family F member 1-like n=1 Tax=Lagopus leucura TaxID=30410 RepID=UPI001C675984|nr:ATP-binding cassette sub-family F member 1-like [Lagopus leucura]
MRRNHRLKVGFFNQQAAEQLRLGETAAEYLQKSFNLPHQDARKCLGRFGLEGHAHTLQIAKLSGGRGLQGAGLLIGGGATKGAGLPVGGRAIKGGLATNRRRGYEGGGAINRRRGYQ